MSTSVEDRILVERAQDYYAQHLRNLLEPGHNGEFVVIGSRNWIVCCGTRTGGALR